jgi:bacillithiol system protein YtxJ
VTGEGPVRLTAEADVERACEHDVAVIYKHSPRCGVSLSAEGEVRRFMAAEPAVPVYVVDVVRDRAVSRVIEGRFGIRHSSPQVILLRRGVPVWDGSHRAVTAAALVQQAIQGLNERQRMAVLLSKFEDMSYQDIADTMGMSVQAIKSLLSRARANLKVALNPYLEEGLKPTADHRSRMIQAADLPDDPDA